MSELYCGACGRVIKSRMVKPRSACNCGCGEFTVQPPDAPRPLPPYRLTREDRRFLRSMRIYWLDGLETKK